MGVRGDMESGGSLYRTRNGESPLVYNAQIYDAPLLPFEKQLIETIGATEEEYRYLVTEALKKSRVRPAGYEHIPDIRCDPTTTLGSFLISLAVGVTLTAITYLLTPKPKQPKGIDRRDLGDINNAGRFNPTHGFDSQAELANYGSPIPIIFGKAEFNGEDYSNGGMLVTPKLVWSRMFSWGTQQAVKLGFLVGEQGGDTGITSPDLSGIFLGNNPLDSIYNSSFAFYWCPKGDPTKNGSRPVKDNFKYGDSAIRSMDVSNPEVLRCPTKNELGDKGFSATYSPSNNNEFGCFAPIPNGSAYRVNWNHVAMPDPGAGAGDNQPEHSDELAWQRIKIAGWYTSDVKSDRNEGPGWRAPMGGKDSGDDNDFYLEGRGRNYSRRMGLRWYHKWNGSSHDSAIEASNNEVTKIITGIGVKDIVEFYIHPGTQKLELDIYEGDKVPDDYKDESDYKSGVRVDDINSEIDSQRIAADDALQIGEVFQIGRTVWRVIRRDLPMWKPDEDKLQKIWLECIDANGGIENKIGIVSDGVLYPREQSTTSGGNPTNSPGTFGMGWISDSNDPGIKNVPGSNFFPLLRRSKALFKNTRDCETTEIGIRSRVSQQLSGICNFQSLLSPSKIKSLERDGVAIQSGTISSTVKRSSLFTIKARDSNKSYNDDLEGWKDFGKLFAIIGASNVDQYNQIIIRHPEKSRYEYQIVPVPGAGLNGVDDDTEVWHLKDSAEGKKVEVTNSLGTFYLQFHGDKTKKRSIKINNEFIGDYASTVTTTTTVTAYGGPNSIQQDGYVIGKEDWDDVAQMTKTEWAANFGGSGTGADEGGLQGGDGKHSAFLWELFGQATSSSPATKEGTFDFTTTNQSRNKPVKLKIKVKKKELGSGHRMRSGGSAGENETHTWQIYGAADASEKDQGIFPVNTDNERNLDWTGPHTREDGSWYEGDWFRIQKSCAGSNPWAQNASGGVLAYAGIKVNVTGHGYVQDVKRGLPEAITDEIFTSASDDELHSTKEVSIKLCVSSSMDSENSSNTGWKTNITDAVGDKNLTVKFKGKVIDIRPNWTGRYRGWQLQSITITGHTGTWDKDDEIEFYKDTITNASNPFWRALQGKLGYKLKITNVVGNTTETTSSVDPAKSRIFEGQSQYADISFYGNLVQKSNDSSPEHALVYVNECVSNTSLPKYDNTTTAALVLKASRNFSALDQIRVWLKEGLKVERLHPDDSSTTGASNLFTDLAYYLLTDRTGGIGKALGSDADAKALVDKDQLIATSKFLRTNKLFFNGAIADPINLRGYLADMAPNFLCDFILADGKFSLKPAVPVNSSGEISNDAVEIKQLFTSGNILEDSFTLDYINVDERRKFKAVVRYRKESQNKLPYEQTVTVRHAGGDGTEAIETFDLTSFCTTKEHAQLVGKYYLSLRERITHTCSFKTTPYGLDLAPGDYIRVTTESSPYNAVNNGSISASGVITSVKDLSNGSYNVLYYPLNDSSEVETGTMNVSNGKVSESKFYSSIFSVVSTTDSQNVYRVEQLTLAQDNTVDIVASEYPCNSSLVSLIAKDLRSGDAFIDDSGAKIPYHKD